jgi:hypothetical protein
VQHKRIHVSDPAAAEPNAFLVELVHDILVSRNECWLLKTSFPRLQYELPGVLHVFSVMSERRFKVIAIETSSKGSAQAFSPTGGETRTFSVPLIAGISAEDVLTNPIN